MSIFSTVGSLIGGIFGKKSASQDRNFQFAQNAADRGFANNQRVAAQKFTTRERLQAQAWAKAEARNARLWDREQDRVKVQRIVNDAKTAGIHPLAALGVSGPMAGPVASSTPVSSPGSSFSGSNPLPSSGNPMGEAIANGLTSLGDVARLRMEEKLTDSQVRLNDAQASAIMTAPRVGQQARANVQRATIGSSANYGTADNRSTLSEERQLERVADEVRIRRRAEQKVSADRSGYDRRLPPGQEIEDNFGSPVSEVINYVLGSFKAGQALRSIRSLKEVAKIRARGGAAFKMGGKWYALDTRRKRPGRKSRSDFHIRRNQ